MNYKSIERPGYLGGQREQKFQEWNNKYGKNNWRLAWEWGNRFLNFDYACCVYENAYYSFFQENPAILLNLIWSASDVYDDSPTNVNSGVNYTAQETNHTHIQDIAIRRCLARLDKHFQGKELIQIRDTKGTHPLSLTLSPGRVNFHKPQWIVRPWLEGWWQQGSVECWYQSNRFLQVKVRSSS